ncbi:DUF6268 family outer membrane beta-barrel protein [Aquimarina addita]|uniref:DUF6268 family outer membrane beta-barrel protein n=1 Tax=Aquimarina addita TaxID=870485 RepID=UPI0031EFC7F1
MIFSTVNIGLGQDVGQELFGFDYSTIQGIGDTSIEKYSIDTYLDTDYKKTNIGFGFIYDNYNFLFTNAPFYTGSELYTDLHTIGAKLSYTYLVNDTWSANLFVLPMISSDLEQKITNEDIVINAKATVTKKWGSGMNSSSLLLGIGYDTTFGVPQLIPLISYQKRINLQWEYILGFPETYINFHHNTRHIISAATAITGLYGNLSSPFYDEDIRMISNTKLTYKTAATSLEYKYRIQPHWTTVVKAGYSFYNELAILDKDHTTIYDFNTDSSFFITMGLKFNLNK